MKLCVLALLVQRTAEIRTGRNWPALRHELEQIHAVECRFEGKDIVRTSKLTARLVTILDQVGATKPSAVLPA